MDSSTPLQPVILAPVSAADDSTSLFGDVESVQVRALLLGTRISTSGSEGLPKLSDKPLILAERGRGCAVVFRYGALVLFGMSAEDEAQLCASLRVREPLARPEIEQVEMRLDRALEAEPRVEDGVIIVPDTDLQRLTLVGEALAKSVVLAHHESAIATIFDRIEPLAQDLRNNRNWRRHERELLQYIGGALLSEQRMVGRVEVREKPELLWDNPTLERFYVRLEREYELRERATSVERKLGLISRTAQTALDLLEQRSARRVEWYIVALIVVEILLTLYSMLAK